LWNLYACYRREKGMIVRVRTLARKSVFVDATAIRRARRVLRARSDAEAIRVGEHRGALMRVAVLSV